MTSVVRALWVLAAVWLLAGCAEKLHELTGPSMGSTYSVKYVAADASPAPAQVHRQVEAILQEVDQQLSTYRSDSLVSRFNQLPAGSCAPMPDALLALLDIGEQLALASDGAFDLTVEPLINLWGFGPQSRGEQVPSAQQIAAAQSLVGHRYLQVQGQQLCKSRAVQLDFNSIGAGYAVDRVSAMLEAFGITNYLVEITGELKARGRKPDGSAWRIAIEQPQDTQQVAARVLELDGLALSTSGDYRNYFERDGKRYSHTIDARNGLPITHRLASVSVLDASATRADGLSTVLLLLGPEQGFAYAEQAGIAAWFIRRTEQGFASRGTSAFNRRFGAGVAQ